MLNFAIRAKKLKEQKYLLNGLFGAFLISCCLIILEPFGMTFRNTSAITLALSYGVISMSIFFVANKYIKFSIIRSLNRLSMLNSVVIWNILLLTLIALANFAYFGFWSCHCETEYNFRLFAFQFLPRTYAFGGIVIFAELVMSRFSKDHHLQNISKRKDILALSSMGNYLKIKRINDKESVREFIERGNLKKLNKKDYPHFFRCHRSHLINLHYVKEVIKKDRKYSAVLDHGIIIPVSARKVDELKSLLRN